jgi:type II secretory pathway pseudopilin PulG
MSTCRTHRRAAIAMVEAVLATIVVGLMLVAALRVVVAARGGQVHTDQRILAAHLAAELMAEILSQAYSDPDEPPVFGPEISELSTGTRTAFDDVDDYHNWSESPPQERDGRRRDHLQGWRRSVQVVHVEPRQPDQTALSDRGVKRITISITFNGIPAGRLTAYRSAAVSHVGGR